MIVIIRRQRPRLGLLNRNKCNANTFADCVASTIKNVPQRIGNGDKSSTGCASATMQKTPLWWVYRSLSSSFRSSGLAQGKSTENLPSHIRPPASCARGEMPPAFLGVMAGRIFLWVQAQAIRRKDDDNDHSGYRPQRGLCRYRR